MGAEEQVVTEPRLGRYVVHGQIASGGMATVHLGRLVGAAGFARTVAIKRLHPLLAKDPAFVSSFVDEARLAACIRHPNVASTLDVVVHEDEILVVMEYVHGESLSRLARTQENGRAPLPIVLSIASQMLSGLHAAHEATSPRGEPLKLVHRDVSPQNVVVGVDGVARVLDFGVAKATWRMQDTRDGLLKGKVAYMAPEQLNWRVLDRRTDIFAASIVLWEALTGERLFAAETAEETVRKILLGQVSPPSSRVATLPPRLDSIVLRGLALNPDDRFATAFDMAVALEAVAPIATARVVGSWVASGARETLAQRANMVQELEQATIADDEQGLRSTGRTVRRVSERARAAEAPTSSLARSAAPISARPEPDETNSGLSRPVPGSHPRRRWVLAGGLAIVSLLAAVAFERRHVRGGHGKSVVAEPEPVPKAASTLPLPVTSSAPVTSSLEATMPSATASTEPRHERPVAPKAASGRANKIVGCDPPYTVSPDGIRRFRPECI